MTWQATIDEMLLGDMTGGEDLKQRYLDDARDEMYICIGEYYEIPLPDVIPKQVERILKHIHTHLASGRFILAQATGGQDEELHAYGLYLITGALLKLKDVGVRVTIPGATPAVVDPITGATGSGDMRAAVVGGDACSPFDVFNDYTSLGGRWQPVIPT